MNDTITKPFRLFTGGYCPHITTMVALIKGPESAAVNYTTVYYDVCKPLTTIMENDLQGGIPSLMSNSSISFFNDNLPDENINTVMNDITLSAIAIAKKHIPEDLEVSQIETHYTHGWLEDKVWGGGEIHIDGNIGSALRLISSTAACTQVLERGHFDFKSLLSYKGIWPTAFKEYFYSNSVQAEPLEWLGFDLTSHPHRAIKHTGSRVRAITDISFKNPYVPNLTPSTPESLSKDLLTLKEANLR